MDNNKIIILMSTYNGEKYLCEQLDSLFSQEGVKVNVFVRDDGSSDKTISILQEYEKKSHLQFYTGKNLKPAKSFMNLIYNAPKAKYYALCDQDDIWIQGKLKTAIEFLSNCDKPALFYHGMNIVDKKLNSTGYYFRETEKAINLKYSCLYGSGISGCTMVFNDKLIDAIKIYEPSYITMHDEWIHRVCLCIHGCIYGDKTAYINYRQHENNAIGMHQRTISEQIYNLKQQECSFSKLAREMLSGYEKYLDNNEKKFLHELCDYKIHIGEAMHLSIEDLNSHADLKTKMKCLIKMIYKAL